MSRPVTKKPSQRTISKKLIAGVVVLLLVAGGVAYGLIRPSSNSPASENQTPSSASTSSQKNSNQKSDANLDAPTDAQKNAARDTPSSVAVTNSNGKKTVTPVITSYDKQQVRAFVDGVIEDGGTCTATYTHGGDVVTATSTGISDASHTTCGPMSLPGPVNISGDWSVVVTYSSGSYYGKSDAKTLKV